MRNSIKNFAIVFGLTFLTQTASADLMCVRTTLKNSKVSLVTRVATVKCPRNYKKLFDIAAIAPSVAPLVVPGPQGPAGNANVIASTEVGPGFNGGSPLTSEILFGIRTFSFNIPAPEITSAVIESGQITVYGRLLGYNPTLWATNESSALPISLTYQSPATMTDVWSAKITPGNIEIQFVNDANFYTSISTAHRFKYVVIPKAAL